LLDAFADVDGERLVPVELKYGFVVVQFELDDGCLFHGTSFRLVDEISIEGYMSLVKSFPNYFLGATLTEPIGRIAIPAPIAAKATERPLVLG
jgi:hypothetical protein